MRIIIVGAGTVGEQIAISLLEEGHDVIIIERDEKRAKYIEEILDTMVFTGNGANISTLNAAGVKEADILISVTDSDEVNMISSLIANKLGAKKKIIRIKDQDYLSNLKAFKEDLGIDFIINPANAAADQIEKLILNPFASSIATFAEGKISMVKVRLREDFKIINKKIREIEFPGSLLIGAINRDDNIIIPKGEEVLLPGDGVYILGKTDEIKELHTIFGKREGKILKVIIVGGSDIGTRLAQNLEKYDIEIKLIEKSPERSNKVASILEKTLVINGDGTDKELLKREGIELTDSFVSLTKNDEDNLVFSLLAKKLGAKKVIAKVTKPTYSPILETIGIDAAISPRLITASYILSFIRKSKILNLTLIKEGEAEIVEVEVPENKVINNISLGKLKLPKDMLIATIIRDKEVIIPHGEDILLPKDKVIIITLKKNIKKIENIFRKRV